ncbi:MAG: hypothetical protein EON93_08900 [Burkholderiales bacterium]|nr:MAG: hypothetical protein EON93_08900 [Burkholderiales bacterium]
MLPLDFIAPRIMRKPPKPVGLLALVGIVLLLTVSLPRHLDDVRNPGSALSNAAGRSVFLTYDKPRARGGKAVRRLDDLSHNPCRGVAAWWMQMVG